METELLFNDRLASSNTDDTLIVQDLTLCRGCKSCMVCPEHLYTVNKQGQCIRSDPRNLCIGLGMCVDMCPTGSAQFTEQKTNQSDKTNSLSFDDDLDKLI